MRFDLVDLQLFIAVAETRSITNGAQRVHLALASASERIKGLEAALGVSLLRRVRRGVELTAAGESLLDHARIVIHNVEALRGDLAEFSKGMKATVRFLGPVPRARLATLYGERATLRAVLEHGLARHRVGPEREANFAGSTRLRRAVAQRAGERGRGRAPVLADRHRVGEAQHRGAGPLRHLSRDVAGSPSVPLDGEGVLLLDEEETPVRPGHVVARPPATGVAHAFRAGDPGLTYLAYGTREPNDICYYPRSSKIFWRGVGLIARLEPLDYWDGED